MAFINILLLSTAILIIITLLLNSFLNFTVLVVPMGTFRPNISAFLWVDIVHCCRETACVEIPQVFKAGCALFRRVLVLRLGGGHSEP